LRLIEISVISFVFAGVLVFPLSEFGEKYILKHYKGMLPSNMSTLIQFIYIVSAITSPLFSAIIQSEYDTHKQQRVVVDSNIETEKMKYCFGIMQTKHSIMEEGFQNFSNRLHLFKLFELKFHYLFSLISFKLNF
jgi:hypothetical protein